MKRLIFSFLFLSWTQCDALDRVYKGYTPFMLSDLNLEPFNIEADRALITQSYQGWVKLHSLLTEEELSHFTLRADKRIWVDACKPADLAKVRENVTGWINEQFWAKKVRIDHLSILTRRICSEWDEINQFKLVDKGVLSNKLKLLAGINSRLNLEVEISGSYMSFVSKAAIKANTYLEPEAVDLVWQPIDNVPFTNLTIDLSRHYMTRYSLSAGHIINMRSLAVVLPVEAGDKVTALLTNDGLVIEAGARALGRGASGNKVKVLVDGANMPVEGKVIKKGVVEIGA